MHWVRNEKIRYFYFITVVDDYININIFFLNKTKLLEILPRNIKLSFSLHIYKQWCLVLKKSTMEAKFVSKLAPLS